MISLLVEDEAMVRELWERLLHPVSDEIRTAETLPDALAKMAMPPPPDLVLLDLRVPGSPSPEFTLQHIRQLKALNPHATVLVLTGVSDPSLPALARELGADGFSPKMSATSQDALYTAICDAMRSPREGEPVYARSVELLDKLTAFLTPGSPAPAEPA